MQQDSCYTVSFQKMVLPVVSQSVCSILHGTVTIDIRHGRGYFPPRFVPVKTKGILEDAQDMRKIKKCRFCKEHLKLSTNKNEFKLVVVRQRIVLNTVWQMAAFSARWS